MKFGTTRPRYGTISVMQMKTLEVGSFEVNCTVLTRGDTAWIVDPGADAVLILKTLESLGAKPDAILLTHGHFDHIGAINDLQRAFPGLPVWMHPADRPYLTHPLNRMEPFYPGISEPSDVRDCRQLPNVTVIETPGHTPGGVCYHFPEENLLLTGDTLFAGSVGRTDFPGGSLPVLQHSLAKLKMLPDGTRVIPGHGPFTTVGDEKRGNPFLQ